MAFAIWLLTDLPKDVRHWEW